MEAHATLTKLIHKHPLASSLITMVRHGIALWIFKFDLVSVSNIIIAVKHRLEFALGAIQLDNVRKLCDINTQSAIEIQPDNVWKRSDINIPSAIDGSDAITEHNDAIAEHSDDVRERGVEGDGPSGLRRPWKPPLNRPCRRRCRHP